MVFGEWPHNEWPRSWAYLLVNRVAPDATSADVEAFFKLHFPSVAAARLRLLRGGGQYGRVLRRCVVAFTVREERDAAFKQVGGVLLLLLLLLLLLRVAHCKTKCDMDAASTCDCPVRTCCHGHVSPLRLLLCLIGNSAAF